MADLNPWHAAYDKRTKALVTTVLDCLGLKDKAVRASAIADADWNGAAWLEGAERIIEVNVGTAFLAEDLLARLLAHRDVWPEIGESSAEGEPTVQALFDNADELFRLGGGAHGYSRPKIVCAVRARYAEHLSLLAWDFLVLHELGHVVLGHVAYDATLGRPARREPRRNASLKDASLSLADQAIESDADRFATTWVFRLRAADGDSYPFLRSSLPARTCVAMDVVRAAYGLFLLLCAGRESDVHILDGSHPPPRIRQAAAAVGFEALLGTEQMLLVAQDAVRMDDYYPRLVVGKRVDIAALRALLFDPHALRIMAARARLKEKLEPLSWVPAFCSAKKFSVPRQGDGARGCIPACTIGVLAFLGLSDLPKESDLAELMWGGTQTGSGFERLKRAMSNEAVVNVEVVGQAGVAARTEKLITEGHYVLVAVKNPAAHCVVVETIASGHVYFHDPSDGYPRIESTKEFAARSIGDLATISRP